MKVTASGILGTLAGTASASNFYASCLPASVSFSGTTLTARCRAINGQYKCSKLNMNSCLKNTVGSLQDDPNAAGPHLSGECVNCSLDATDSGIFVGVGTSLHCQCDNKLGRSSELWPVAIIDINQFVDNNNGMLQCHEVKASAC